MVVITTNSITGENDEAARVSSLPLAGVRILECASVIAGPYCSYVLTLLGADTIKIERPTTGD